MRIVVRILIAGVLAIIGTSAAGPALAAQAALTAHAQNLYEQSYKTTAATSSSGIAVAIGLLTPRYVSPATSTIEVKGTVTNHTGGPVAGVQVELYTGTPFTSRSSMESYVNAPGTYFGNPITAAVWQDQQTLHSGATTTWSVSFPASTFAGFGFGVFPLAAQSSLYGGMTQGTARTLLPLWPGSSGAPRKLNIAWVWPLIDTPQQGACSQALATNDLAASMAPGGRLNGLMSAARQYAGTRKVTWAVDPALLSDASVMMTSRYKVGGNAQCTGTKPMPRSAAAGTWLSDLKAGTADDPSLFLTGYADPDVSALTHAGLDSDIRQAYKVGNTVAGKILAKSFGQGSAIAWPDGGAADASVLTALAQEGRVGTTVLSTAEMPILPHSYVDDAVAHVTTGMSTQMNVLLADSQISRLLGSATAASPASSQFAVTQDFLAETAMIVAEAPNSARSAVIAPPSRWDPSAAEAGELLSLSTAPWLRPVSLSSLTSPRASAGAVAHVPLPGSHAAPQELGPEYLGEVTDVRQMADQFGSLLSPANDGTLPLQAAVTATESTAWRGLASKGGRNAIGRLKGYIDHNESLVKIISGAKVLLGGTSGETPVSVFNGLPHAVRVQVKAVVPAGSPLSVTNPAPQTIPRGQTVTFRLQLHSAPLGSTLLQLQLVTRNGTPLTGPPHLLNVETTRYGRTLLILIAAALGVLVLTSVARWVRRWLHDGGSGHHVGGGGAGAGGMPGDSVSSSGAGVSGADFSGVSWSAASGAGSGSGGTG